MWLRSAPADMGWSVSALVDEVQFPRAELAHFLRLSAPAFERRTRKNVFTREHRAKMLRLVSVLDRAQRVLGDRRLARCWIIHRNRALAFRDPLSLLETKSGTARVFDVLSRIEDGHFA